MGVSVRIRLFANLREKVGKDKVTIEFEKCPTIKEVLEKVRENFPEVGRVIFVEERFDGRYKVLSGNRLVGSECFGEPAGDSIAILPPVSGG
ncbi:MAG: MoaD/ThiS family protein [Candidatus Verstraetearchaeota archaeon]|nr:MoaD/ThiS family protein [Candidatus Verstraetearchaeota archaeon]